MSLKFINYSFIDELKTFILSNPNKINDRCNNYGCMMHMERIKKIVAHAYAMRFITNKDLSSNLQIIGEICEVGVALNFYIARHTCNGK